MQGRCVGAADRSISFLRLLNLLQLPSDPSRDPSPMSQTSSSPIVVQPVIMAGGLGPDNVAAAIEQCKPYGVDSLTKTSIKYDGGYMEKDIDKVRQFCINADAAAAKIGQ